MFSAQCKIKHEGIQNASTFIYEILIRSHAYSKKYGEDKNLMLPCRHAFSQGVCTSEREI